MIFSADNQQVATVSEDGLVTAHAPGQATITAKTANGKTATCVITVENEEIVTPPSNDIVAPTPELSDETVVGDTTSVSAPVEVSQDALNNATARETCYHFRSSSNNCFGTNHRKQHNFQYFLGRNHS